jgi:hypothetical protein
MVFSADCYMTKGCPSGTSHPEYCKLDMKRHQASLVFSADRYMTKGCQMTAILMYLSTLVKRHIPMLTIGLGQRIRSLFSIQGYLERTNI